MPQSELERKRSRLVDKVFWLTGQIAVLKKELRILAKENQKLRAMLVQESEKKQRVTTEPRRTRR